MDRNPEHISGLAAIIAAGLAGRVPLDDERIARSSVRMALAVVDETEAQLNPKPKKQRRRTRQKDAGADGDDGKTGEETGTQTGEETGDKTGDEAATGQDTG